MKIYIASLTLRFYKSDGWTAKKVRHYLIDKTMKITYRSDLEYFAVYPVAPNKTDCNIFDSSIRENEFIDNPPYINKKEADWYIKD